MLAFLIILIQLIITNAHYSQTLTYYYVVTLELIIAVDIRCLLFADIELI